MAKTDKEFTGWDGDHIRRIVERFVTKELRIEWSLVGPKIRRAYLDSLVVEEMRAACFASPLVRIQLSAHDILSLRTRLEGELNESYGLSIEGS